MHGRRVVMNRLPFRARQLGQALGLLAVFCTTTQFFELNAVIYQKLSLDDHAFAMYLQNFLIFLCISAGKFVIEFFSIFHFSSNGIS